MEHQTYLVYFLRFRIDFGRPNDESEPLALPLHQGDESRGSRPLVFIHEFAGDFRSYETQVRYFVRRYRCVAYNARGYPPSDVPDDEQAYSRERARDDVRAVLEGLRIDQAHIVGISMGGFATCILA